MARGDRGSVRLAAAAAAANEGALRVCRARAVIGVSIAVWLSGDCLRTGAAKIVIVLYVSEAKTGLYLRPATYVAGLKGPGRGPRPCVWPSTAERALPASST